MFGHLFLYNLKSIYRNKETVFWSFLFPFLLATLFFLTLGNLSDAEGFRPVPIGVEKARSLKAVRHFTKPGLSV
jgi:ABC-2 type transport system permease protein